ncbi:MAG: hypothetical protein Q8J97_03365, partial [Flavobacteriaceae bacterium]|nr:hypothetical protein [Flavobacteriaceae bacterium]
AAGTAARISVTASDAAKLAAAGTFFMACYEARVADNVVLELRIPAASGTATPSASSPVPQMPAAIVAIRTLNELQRDGDALLLAAGGSTILTVPFGYTGRLGLTVAGRALNSTLLRSTSQLRVAAIPTFYACSDASTIAPIAGRVMRVSLAGTTSPGPWIDPTSGIQLSTADLRLDIREADTLIQASQWRVCFSTDSGLSYAATPLSFSIAAIHAVNNKWAFGRRSANGEQVYEGSSRVLSFFGSNLDLVWPGVQQESSLQVAFDTQPCTDVGSTATQVGSSGGSGASPRVTARSATAVVNPFSGLVRLNLPLLPATASNGATESLERVAEQQVELR